MRKPLILIFLFSFSLIITERLKAEKYAILISPHETTKDDENNNSFAWYELFLAYEDLVEKQGYTHKNIYVCYGEGYSFDSKYDCYNISSHGWPEIVDYNNRKSSILSVFDSVANRATDDDHVVIRWVAGHAEASDEDDYRAITGDRIGTIDFLLEREVIAAVNTIQHYSQKLVFWMTCHSGCLVTGEQRLEEPYTIVSTACRWDQGSLGYSYPEVLTRTVYDYWITGYLHGQAPGPDGPIYIPSADDNRDGYITMNELISHTETSVITQTSDATIFPFIQYPQHAGFEEIMDVVTISGLAPSAYLRLQNIEISGSASYDAFTIIAAGGDTYFRILSGGNATMEAIDKVSLKPGFHSRAGSEFNAHIDPAIVSSIKEKHLNSIIDSPNEEIEKDNITKDIKDNEQEKPKEKIPTVFSCSQNYPNPFRSSTTINYGLPVDSDVNFCIYNLLGQRVRTLNMKQSAGYKSYTWDRTDDAGNVVGSGIYFYVLKADDEFQANRKMLVLK